MTGSSYGLLFGLADDYSHYYLFDINVDYGQFHVLRRDSGGFTTVVPITDAPLYYGGTNFNHLKATRHEDQITLELNGEVLGTWTDGKITGVTKVGIVTNPYPYLPGSDTRFDNFAVRATAGSGSMTAQESSELLIEDNVWRDLRPTDVGW